MKRFERFLGKAFFVNVVSVSVYLYRHRNIDLNAYLLLCVGSLLGLVIYEIVKNMIVSWIQSRKNSNNQRL